MLNSAHTKPDNRRRRTGTNRKRNRRGNTEETKTTKHEDMNQN